MPADQTIALFGIGSTNLRSAVGTPDDTVTTDIHVEPTRIRDLESQVCSRLEALQSQAAIDAVSIACAGLVDGGVVQEIDTPDDAVVRDIPLGPTIENRFDLPVRLENDCTAAALAEWVYGAGQTADCVVHLTMGTGIGAGVVDHGHVVRGADGHATEVGLFPIGPPDRASSGVPGAWEAYCSGRGIAGFVRDLLKTETRETVLDAEDLTARDVFEAASDPDPDPVADDYLDRIARYNAAGLGTLVNAYNPDLVTVGGGVGASNFETILERTRPHIERYALPAIPDIQPTRLGDEIGLYGALAPYATQSVPTETRSIPATDD
ncbi:ROK family protein [Halobacteria archaeon AArc-m2/3/4]|uniref:ROK family protein n=1 Tax=Natronoglomus mannanivorans TaxID=2979990 RepID=A0AAP3E438_9EURY|nr:ROK family protein [Halobacteria archaeon AArc-xg1-1]MCU4974907.1 ROK family protein [Halobacteria archaeon AArc-m2/3/4]